MSRVGGQIDRHSWSKWPLQVVKFAVALMLGFPQYRLHALSQNRNYQYSFVIHKGYKWRLIVYPLDESGNILKDKSNEREMLSKAVMVEILEVSEHYD